jgi:hypothetical protein
VRGVFRRLPVCRLPNNALGFVTDPMTQGPRTAPVVKMLWSKLLPTTVTLGRISAVDRMANLNTRIHKPHAIAEHGRQPPRQAFRERHTRSDSM